MGNHLKGCHRDKQILRAIEKNICLNTEQISALFFPGIKNPQRMAQKRLLSLYKNKRVKRGRDSFAEPCYYFLDKKPGQLDHLLNINWVYVWLLKKMQSWEELSNFDLEVAFPSCRADAFAGIKNTITGETRFYFVEMDIAESGNSFDKVANYNNLYANDEYFSSWWYAVSKKFPTVIIVTTSQKKLAAINRKIDTENEQNLKFIAYHIDQIKGACL